MKNKILFIILALTTLSLAACKTLGSVPNYKNIQAVPSPISLIQSQVDTLIVGMSKKKLQQVFPTATFKDKHDTIEAYEITVHQNYSLVTDEQLARQNQFFIKKGRQQTTHGKRPVRSSKTKFWFYFYKDQYIGMGGPYQWPKGKPEDYLSGKAKMWAIF